MEGIRLNSIPPISPYCETHLKWIREQHNLCLFEYFRLSCLYSCPQLLYNLILYNKSSNYFQKIAMSNQTLTPTSLNSTFKHTSSSTHTFHFDYSSANPALTNCYLLIAIFLLFTLHHHKSKYSVSMYFIKLKKYLTCFGK